MKTDVETVFNDDGFPERTRQLAVDGATSLMRCTWDHYAPNDSTWILDRRTYTETFDGDCGTGSVEAATYFYYDGLNTDAGWATPPTVGNLTQQRVWINGGDYAVTTSEYDNHGRVIEVIDPNVHHTTTAFNTTVGPYTQTTATNHLGHTTTVTVDPRRLTPI